MEARAPASASQLPPDLAHTIDPEVLLEDPTNFDLQRGGYNGPPPTKPLSLQEIADAFCDLAGMRFQSEVAGIEKADNRARVVALECLGTWRNKERIVLAPCRPKAAACACGSIPGMTDTARHCSCSRRRGRVALHRHRDGPDRSCRGSDRPATPSSGRVRLRVLPTGRLRREKGAERLSVCLRGVLPGGLDWAPAVAAPMPAGRRSECLWRRIADPGTLRARPEFTVEDADRSRQHVRLI